MSISFQPAWWLPSPHLQTIWAPLSRRRRIVRFDRETLITPDDDDLMLDHVSVEGAAVRIVLLHGLEGSSNSVYMQGLASRALARGWSVTALNFRACGRDPRNVARPILNRGRRLYHSGETSDFDFVIRTLRRREPDMTFVAVGTSLGGNVLLKWLGETAGERLLSAAATMSVPYDLAAGARHLETPLGRFYVSRFVASLAPKLDNILSRFPDDDRMRLVDRDKARRARTFREFDDAATAPIHDFRDAEDYWERSSSIRFVGTITTPALCISAEDDPFLPRDVLRELRTTVSSQVELLVTSRGGHAGFVEGWPVASRYWAEQKIIDWLAGAIASRR